MTNVKLRKKLGEKRIKQIYNLSTWVLYANRIGNRKELSETVKMIQEILGAKIND